MLTKTDCTLPLDAERRDLIVRELCDIKLDTLADCGGLRDVVLNGYKGLLEYSDEELVEVAEYLFSDDWEV